MAPMRRTVLAILVLLHLALGGVPGGAAWCERDAGLDLDCRAQADACCAPEPEAPAEVDCCAELDLEPALVPTLPDLPALPAQWQRPLALVLTWASPPRRIASALPAATGPPPHLVVLRRTQLLI